MRSSHKQKNHTRAKGASSYMTRKIAKTKPTPLDDRLTGNSAADVAMQELAEGSTHSVSNAKTGIAKREDVEPTSIVSTTTVSEGDAQPLSASGQKWLPLTAGTCPPRPAWVETTPTSSSQTKGAKEHRTDLVEREGGEEQEEEEVPARSEILSDEEEKEREEDGNETGGVSGSEDGYVRLERRDLGTGKQSEVQKIVKEHVEDEGAGQEENGKKDKTCNVQ